MKHRGLKDSPELAIGDGALGFWKALTKVYHNTRWQRGKLSYLIMKKMLKNLVSLQLIGQTMKLKSWLKEGTFPGQTGTLTEMMKEL